MKAKYTGEDVKLLDQQVTYDSPFASYTELQLQYKQFNGEWGATYQRGLVRRRQAVAVLLYDVKQDAIVLLEQFRVGAIEDKDSPWLFEVVAGLCDTDESLEQVALREVAEEAGCQIDTLHPIMTFYTTPGGCNEQVHLYYALVDSTGIGGVHGVADEGEDIQVHVVTRDAAMQAISQGDINSAISIIALQWLQLHYETLEDGHSVN